MKSNTLPNQLSLPIHRRGTAKFKQDVKFGSSEQSQHTQKFEKVQGFERTEVRILKLTNTSK